jgi:hypothetical protein
MRWTNGAPEERRPLHETLVEKQALFALAGTAFVPLRVTTRKATSKALGVLGADALDHRFVVQGVDMPRSGRPRSASGRFAPTAVIRRRRP